MAAVTIDGRPMVVTGHRHGPLRVLDLTDGRQLRTFGSRAGALAIATAVLAGIPVVVTVGDMAVVEVWSLTDGRLVGTVERRDTWVHALVAREIAGRPVVLTAGSDGQLHVWDLTTRALLDVVTLPGAVYAATALAGLVWSEEPR